MFLIDLPVFFNVGFGAVENMGDVLFGKSLDTEQMPVRVGPGFLRGDYFSHLPSGYLPLVKLFANRYSPVALS